MDKETKTIRADPELWDKAKVYCVGKHIDLSSYIDSLMRKDLEKKG